MAKPTTFPAAEPTAGKLPEQAVDHISDVFAFATVTTAAALAVDVGDPPASVLGDVLADVAPQATIDFPGGAVEAFTTHANRPDHVSDWFMF